MTYQKRIGDLGEKIAADFLRDKGYQLLDKKFITRYGEIDLVAQDSDIIVFVEVKTRTSQNYGLPEASMTMSKLERIQNAGLLWLQENPAFPDDWRIDLIAIILDKNKKQKDIQHFISVYL